MKQKAKDITKAKIDSLRIDVLKREVDEWKAKFLESEKERIELYKRGCRLMESDMEHMQELIAYRKQEIERQKVRKGISIVKDTASLNQEVTA